MPTLTVRDSDVTYNEGADAVQQHLQQLANAASAVGELIASRSSSVPFVDQTASPGFKPSSNVG